MAQTFNIIEYLSGLTNFIFDKAVLNRVALDNEVANIKEYSELTEEKRDMCKASLLETVVFGAYQTASTTSEHGSYKLSVGAQTVTSKMLESIKSELRRIYKKYGLDEKIEALDETDGGLKWINENDTDY